MDKETKKKGNRDFEVIECHRELMDILESLKQKVNGTTWGAMTPSNYEATLILAKKIKEAKIN